MGMNKVSLGMNKVFYYIDDEMVWAYAKDTMKEDIVKREEELTTTEENFKWVLDLLGYELKTPVQKAFDLYLNHLRNELEQRRQIYERFSTWYENLGDREDWTPTKLKEALNTAANYKDEKLPENWKEAFK